jgi:hypothetical protein
MESAAIAIPYDWLPGRESTMHSDFYIKAYERLKWLELASEKKKGLVRSMPVYRRMLALSAISVGCTLLVLGLFDHFASERSGRRHSGTSAPLEIARLNDSPNPAVVSSSQRTGKTLPSVQPGPKTPGGLTVVNIYHSVEPSPKILVDFTKKIEAPPPDPGRLSSPNDGNALDHFRPDLPSAPPMDAPQTIGEVTPTLGPSSPVDLTNHVQASPDLAAALSPDPSARNEVRTDVPSVRLASEPPADASGHPFAGASADAKAVVGALAKYSAAWNTKRAANITALRPGLPRRAVQQELSSVRSITMRIQPISAPTIQGNRATVECIHQVDQVFSDGVKKENPGIKMIYVLVRRDGNWLIEESR